jgi:predicted component of type VI protein secretion system
MGGVTSNLAMMAIDDRRPEMDAKTSTQINNVITEASKTIPTHIVERLESEWRQMRQTAPQPTPTSKSA